MIALGKITLAYEGMLVILTKGSGDNRAVQTFTNELFDGLRGAYNRDAGRIRYPACDASAMRNN